MKMLHRVLILIISVFCQVWRSQEIFISPNSKLIVINEGETLNIACISTLIRFKSSDENSKIKSWKAVYQYNISKENAAVSDTGWYCCADYKALYMNNTYSTEVNWFFVYVKRSEIYGTDYRYKRESSTMILCRQSTDVQPLLIKDNGIQMKMSTNRLLVIFTFDFEYQHRQRYNCSIKEDNETQLYEYNTILFQRHKPIIQFFAKTTFSIQKSVGDNVELSATVYDDLRESLLRWFKSNDMNIINSPKYYVREVRYGDNMALFALLQIIDINIMDSGTYTLQAENSFATVKQNFYLDVIGKSISLLTLNESHYSLKQNTEFHCEVISNPPSNITWSFLRYPNYPLFMEKETVYLTNVTQRVAHYPFYKIKTMVKMLIEVSGQIKCEACNDLGCDSKYETILVSDGLGALGIIGPKESVIQGDNIELICAASVYNYTNDFTWTVRVNQTEKPVTETDRLKLVQHRTPFTYRSTLKLNNVQRSDAQDYFCTVEFITPHKIIDSLPERATYKLIIYGKSISLLTLNESHYSLKQNTEFYCEVISNPPSNITWSFLRYPNYPLFTEKETVYLTNVTQEVAYNSSYKIKSMVKMLIEVSGQIKCEACNTLGCDSKNETILVSDGLGALSIIGPRESVMQGDNVELICAASVYNYMNDFTWTVRVNQTEKPVTETDRLKLVQHRTPFTYRSTLKLNNVQRSDAQDYFCTVEFITPHQIIDSLSERATYKLIIYDVPFFINTNMNRTKIRNIDLMTEDLDTVILQCFADGMPKPNVTWYKDNVPLKENDQYLFKYNYQELHIKYFMRHDSGTYSCRAINRAGSNETYQQITVKYTKYDTLELILVISIPILSFIIVILTIFITIKICREKKRRRKADLIHFDGVTSEYINPNLTVKHLAKFLPYDEKWEFQIERLNLKEKLDNGYFGVVMKAEALGICRNESITTVAVKMIRQSDKPIYIRAFLSELNIMLQLGKHLNIVNLLGASTKNVLKGELLMIIEYCHFGNLHKYLLSHSYNFINQIDSKTGKLDPSIGVDILTTVNIDNNSSNYEDQNFKPICTQDLLSWSFQVARGMEYLSQKKVLHGDLAARNILLAEDNVVKICNFGLAKYMDEDYYKKKDCASGPIKWMAIESIGLGVFTTQSDVWSFGIMLWEFFTLGKKPYFDIEAEKLYQKLIEGYRLKQPNYAICEIYKIMSQCWKTEPTSRPSFTNLVKSIGNLLEESVKMYYISLKTPYMDMNETNLNVNPGCSKDEYEICNPHPIQDHSHIEFPSSESDYEDIIELSPMLNHKEDVYLKPIKITSKETNLNVNPGCSKDEYEICNPHPIQDHSHIEFPSSESDYEDTIELSPMLNHKEDVYLKPIKITSKEQNLPDESKQ